jgi:hypothetical protein
MGMTLFHFQAGATAAVPFKQDTNTGQSEKHIKKQLLYEFLK